MARTARQGLGRMGERLAREHLEKLGYQIIATNHRTTTGEIDLVAQEGGALVIIEVRTRRGRALGTPEESVTPIKAQRLAALAEEYGQAHPELPADLRVDLVAVELTPSGKLLRVELVRNAVVDQG